MSLPSQKCLSRRRWPACTKLSPDEPDRVFASVSAAERGSVLGLSLERRCLSRLVSFQVGGVPLRHICSPYRNVDNRHTIAAHVKALPTITYLKRSTQQNTPRAEQKKKFKHDTNKLKMMQNMYGWKTFYSPLSNISFKHNYTPLCIVILFNNGLQYKKRQIVVIESWYKFKR